MSMAESLHSDALPSAGVQVQLAATVQEVFESLAAQAQAKAINLGFDMTPDVPELRVNPWMVKEILMNLVDNAIRYTPRGGSVAVRAEVLDGRTVVAVVDNGVGIAPEQRDKVFERFYRVHNADSNGSGLGLAIVRELATRIGAKVQLADNPSGVGLVVVLTFAA
jgi:two-component system sensor histidine kinase TctE